MKKSGFTLIELSIVLVIIALIVGGVLLGQDLIDSAKTRGQITQIEKFQTAMNSFRLKYNCLPGDCKNASAFGMPARGIYAGEGDGNGLIEGAFSNSAASNAGNQMAMGETPVFWIDLSISRLISENFSVATTNTWPSPAPVVGSFIDGFLPHASIGQGNYVYAFSGTYNGGGYKQNGINSFGLSAVTQIAGLPCLGCMNSNPGLTVVQAYNIDKKIDDGLPQSGAVTAAYVNQGIYWATPTIQSNTPYTNAVAGDNTTCFDNNNTAGEVQRYSMTQNNGSSITCALSFQMR